MKTTTMTTDRGQRNGDGDHVGKHTAKYVAHACSHPRAQCHTRYFTQMRTQRRRLCVAATVCACVCVCVRRTTPQHSGAPNARLANAMCTTAMLQPHFPTAAAASAEPPPARRHPLSFTGRNAKLMRPAHISPQCLCAVGRTFGRSVVGGWVGSLVPLLGVCVCVYAN